MFELGALPLQKSAWGRTLRSKLVLRLSFSLSLLEDHCHFLPERANDQFPLCRASFLCPTHAMPSGGSSRQPRPRPRPLGFPEGLESHRSLWESQLYREEGPWRKGAPLALGGSAETSWKRLTWSPSLGGGLSMVKRSWVCVRCAWPSRGKAGDPRWRV